MKAEKRFSADLSSVRAARQFVAETFSELPARFVEDVVLMVSELATNSITHAESGFTLRFETEGGFVRIEITDFGIDLPRKRTPRADEPYGRGLHIVDTLAESWGVELGSEGGKTIWIVVPMPAALASDGGEETPAGNGMVGSAGFDELVPGWLFPARSMGARVLIGFVTPVVTLPLMAWARNEGAVRSGPMLAIAMLAAAATAGWPGALFAGVGLTVQYWYFSVTPGEFASPHLNGGVGVAGLVLLTAAMIALTVRIEAVVQRLRALDEERREQAESQADMRRRAERTAAQAEAVLAIGSVLASAHTVRDVADAALNELNIPAAPTFSSVSVVEDNHLRVVASRGASKELVHDLEKVDLRQSPWLGGVLEGEPVYVEDRADFAARYPSAVVLRLYTSGSWLVVPFRTESSLGLLSMHFSEPQPLRDYRLYFSLVSELLGTSLERARSEEQQRRQHRELEFKFAESDRIARTLSTTVLPPALPRLPGFSGDAWLLPATDQVAGDFYDLFAVEDGWVGVLGDVCGKGAEAAAVASLARYATRTAALQNLDAAAIASVANTALNAEPSDLFCTAGIVRYLRPTGEVEVALAGHLQARLVADGDVTRLGEFGAALGLGEAVMRVERYPLMPGALVVLFSDGLVERDPAFGEHELDAFLASRKGRNAAELSADIRGLVDRLQPVHRDDVAVLVLERNA